MLPKMTDGRLIPAPAGNGLGHNITKSIAAVDPRACGERVHLKTNKHREDG